VQDDHDGSIHDSGSGQQPEIERLPPQIDGEVTEDVDGNEIVSAQNERKELKDIEEILEAIPEEDREALKLSLEETC
jgi:hypothetical protein